MKKNAFLFFLTFFAILFIGCQDNKDDFPSSESPTIAVATTEIYGAPSRKFEIKAALADDLGLQSVRIQIPELSLDKVITFGADPLLKSYDLSYFFDVPADRGTSEGFKIKLTVTDVSNNSVDQEINLRLDGEFDAPAVAMDSPKDGAVILLTSSNIMKVKFTVNDVSGIDFVHLTCAALGIDEMVSVDGAQSYTYAKDFELPTTGDTYILTIATKDKFVIPNEGTTTISVVATNDYPAIYLCDQPKGTNLTTDAAGVPMYFHEKNGQDFEFKYYADTDNKEIYFLGQEGDFAPHSFGGTDGANLIYGASAPAIVLPTKGYYKIKMNPKTLTYSVVKYTPTSTVYDFEHPVWADKEEERRPFMGVNGEGVKDANWDTETPFKNPALRLHNNPDNPYQAVGEITLLGTPMKITFAGQWWNPEWRLTRNGMALRFPGGEGNGIYNPAAGVYKVVVDTELERAFITKK